MADSMVCTVLRAKPILLLLGGLCLAACDRRMVLPVADSGLVADGQLFSDTRALPDLFIPPGVPVSGIRFQDVHLVTGNPRKINPNTPQATEPDNLVRLHVDPLVPNPPPLTYAWTASAGQITKRVGYEIWFKSGVEGEVHIACRIRNPKTGDQLERRLTLRIKKAFQAFPLIKGDYVVWNVSPGQIQAVHLPTRKLLNLGSGSADGFDGVRVIARPPTFPDHSLYIYEVATAKKTILTPPTMKTAWDHRFLRISGDRVYWANTNTYYTQLTLYTMRLGEKAERKVYGPDLVIQTVLDNQRLVFTTKTLSAYNLFNHIYDPTTHKVTARKDLDPKGMVVSWHAPWVVLRDLSRYSLLNLTTKKEIKVTTTLTSLVHVLVSSSHYGGHARDAFGTRGEIFLVALDGSGEKRQSFNHNNFMMPTMDGGRIVYMDKEDIYLFTAP